MIFAARWIQMDMEDLVTCAVWWDEIIVGLSWKGTFLYCSHMLAKRKTPKSLK